MKNILISGGVLAFFLSAGAYAQPIEPVGAPKARASVAAAVQAKFARIDHDRDGFITRAEAESGRQKLRQDRLAQRQERRAGQFARLDVNRDGSISRQEFEQRARQAGSQPRASRVERRAERRALRAGSSFGLRAFERLDTDRDDRVSLAEAITARLTRFDRLDLNRDGVLSVEERRAGRPNKPGRV